MRRVANWADIASSSANTSNDSIRRRGDTRATTAPRWGRISMRPSPGSTFSASLIGVRDTANRPARSTSSRRLPGRSLPVAISSSMTSRGRSERRGVTAPCYGPTRAVRMLCRIDGPAIQGKYEGFVRALTHRMFTKGALGQCEKSDLGADRQQTVEETSVEDHYHPGGCSRSAERLRQ